MTSIDKSSPFIFLTMRLSRKYIYSVVTVAIFAIVALLFFSPDIFEGNVLQQSDIKQGIAIGQEGKAFFEKTGESTRWTNSLFGGMPNFQIAPSYPGADALAWLWKVYSLGLPAPASLLFAMMFGFFIMCLCMKFKWYYSLFASLAWGFSTYFIIIIGAGHIWKFITLAYIPPTIGGIYLCYRERYLSGTAIAALFGALQLQSNHPQMSYYFILVILCMMGAWLYNAMKEKKVKQWGKATACTLAAGLLAVAANSASLYNTWQYSKETVRGRATELAVKSEDSTSGMSRDAITAWSYGLDETFSLLIPNVKGGASIKPVEGESELLSLAQTTKADELSLSPEERQFIAQFPQYFGDQPMTNGPVYVGAFVLMLAILAMFTVEGSLKWALFGISILAILLSWGHNFAALTNLFIDYFPGYSKFRAVSSILVIVEFTIPLLAIMALKKIADTPDYLKVYGKKFYTIFGVFALILFAGILSPGIFGSPFSAAETQYMQQNSLFSEPAYNGVISAIRDIRLSLVRTDALRSLMFLFAAGVIITAYSKGMITRKPVFITALSLIMLIDLFSVNKRYIDSDNFTRPEPELEMFSMTDADRAILRDTTNYRVLDVKGMGSARSSYFHKTIGGYHAAKLTRYNDLLTNQIQKGNMGVLNMLNAKYVLSGDQYEVNPEALGNAWWVDKIDYVNTPNQEMSALDSLDTRHFAVADRKFEKTLGAAIPPALGDTIYETTYAPNELNYRYRSQKGGVAAFSEIFFPWGWEATVDGNPVQIGRVNYVLRALRLPAGEHNVKFRFDPKSLKVTNSISVAAVSLIYLVVFAALFMAWRRNRKNNEPKDLKSVA